MSRLVVDAQTLVKLHNLDTAFEICDETGRVLGYFQPVNGATQPAPKTPFSREELEKFRQQKASGRALAEILAELNQL